MKRNALALCAALLLTIGSATHARQQNTDHQNTAPQSTNRQKTDRDDEGLRGAVRSVREETAKFALRGGKLVEGERLLSEMMVFDARGNFVVHTLYDSAGNIRDKRLHVSASDGTRVVSHRSYKRQPDLRASSTNTPATSGTETSADGEMLASYTSRFRFDHDAQGNRIAKINLRPDGTPSHKTIFTYDARGNRIAQTDYDAGGKATFSVKALFDDRGNIVERFISNNGSDNVSGRYKYDYEFDAQGNWTKRTTSKLVSSNAAERFEPTQVEYREITYESGAAPLNQPSVRPPAAPLRSRGERVAGTRVRLVPPAGFTAAARFPGYEMSSTRASIVVTEAPGSFRELSAAFADEAQLTRRGMNLLGKEEARIGDRPALLLRVAQTAYGVDFRKWMLLFGAGEAESVMLVASFPVEVEAALSESLKTSLLTATLDSQAAVAVTEGLDWTLAAGGDLKIARRVSNTLLYTPGGVFPAPHNAMFFIAGSSLGDIHVADPEAFARRRVLQTAEVTDIQITEVRPVMIAGLPGHEVAAAARWRTDGKSLRILQTTLRNEGTYYIMQGFVSEAQAAEGMELFRRMAASFKRDSGVEPSGR